MDTTKNMVIIKGEFKTSQIEFCELDTTASRYLIRYKNGKTYSYLKENVIFMNNPTILNPQNYIVETCGGKRLLGITQIYEFENRNNSFFKNWDVKYWHILIDGVEEDYKKDELKLKENCLTNVKSSNTFNYLKEVAGLNELLNENGDKLLKKYYEKIDCISDTTVLSLYLDNSKKIAQYSNEKLIFPFGCNKSQYMAVKNAVNNQLSIIQGPPGTGKTQTILNIIANLIINNKSVIVVSNNNSATTNIFEKLAKYNLDFMVASLGSVDNKKKFIREQSGKYPNFLTWKTVHNEKFSIAEILKLEEELLKVYELREKIALLKDKKYNVELEAKYFNEFKNNLVGNEKNISISEDLSSDKIMRLLIEFQELQNNIHTDSLLAKAKNSLIMLRLWIKFNSGFGISKRVTSLFKLKTIIKYLFDNWKFNSQIVTELQEMYYKNAIKEIDEQLSSTQEELNKIENNSDKQLTEQSLTYLKDCILQKYNCATKREVFSEEDLFKNPESILKEYPIVLSSTFSAYTSMNFNDGNFDYVIMDEASQVDIATGALALACAKNAVIVGDLKQLPNVVSINTKKRAGSIKTNYNINDSYDFANKSFLRSIIDVLPSAPATLLREHYRCNPRIISFCNQKFYNNELIIMTKDDDSNDALKIVNTVVGNHERDNYNQRQIDVIRQEILPNLSFTTDKIGITAPYNNQVKELTKQIHDIEIATVHKFQGREKDIIILSTVDDVIKEFTDDPYLLNVAVSRAKKMLIIVTSGNKQKPNGNIADLISYIKYNKGEIINSEVTSVFDYLYSQHREKRLEYLKFKKKISEYDSENLVYTMLQDILKDYQEYGIICFQPLYEIIRDLEKLSVNEKKYVLNPSTHIDFTIYNKLNKQPVAAIEVDGYIYHKEGTVQFERDRIKNHILEICGLPLLRLNTNGSGEREKILNLIA